MNKKGLAVVFVVIFLSVVMSCVRPPGKEYIWIEGQVITAERGGVTLIIAVDAVFQDGVDIRGIPVRLKPGEQIIREFEEDQWYSFGEVVNTDVYLKTVTVYWYDKLQPVDPPSWAPSPTPNSDSADLVKA